MNARRVYHGLRQRVSFLLSASRIQSPQTAHLVKLLASVDRAGLGTIRSQSLISELSPGGEQPDASVRIHPRLTSSGSGSLGEMTALAAIAAAKRPSTILEFGTNQGCSTWHLWANARPDSEIMTIDLPSNVKVEGSTDAAIQGVSARPFLPADNRIRLIEVDSRDWRPDIARKIDLCFIDAGHSYECVRNDTEKAMSLMAENGLIVWHDAAWTRDGYGVNTYLREIRKGGRDVRLLQIGPFDYCGIAVMRMDGPFRVPNGQ